MLYRYGFNILLIALTMSLLQCTTTSVVEKQPVAHHERVKELYEQREYAAVIDTAEILIRKYPSEPMIYYYQGLAHLEKKEFEHGMESYTVADTLSQNQHQGMDSLYSQVMTKHADTFAENENFGDAKKWARRAVEIYPKNHNARYEYHMAEGLELFLEGSKWELWDAIVAFGKAQQAEPENPMPYYYTGKSFYKKDDKDFENIITAYEDALKRNPPESVANKIHSELEDVKRRKKLYEEFWGN